MMKRVLCLLLALALLLPCAAMAQTPQKVVYLTFDDGPKADTPELLKLLEELDVPATFFLMGLSVRAFPEHAKMIVEAGYPVGSHTMGHKPSTLKKGYDYVARDMDRFIQEMRTHVDPNFTTNLFRFPGGSGGYHWRTKGYVRDLGYAWFDWNALNGDAQEPFYRDEEMVEFTMDTVGDQDVVIMLMHEGKGYTRRALPQIVSLLREKGYEFRTLSTSEEDRALLARCDARMMIPDENQIAASLDHQNTLAGKGQPQTAAPKATAKPKSTAAPADRVEGDKVWIPPFMREKTQEGEN